MIGGAVLSGFLGITEPALFGVLTKYKMAFAAAAVGSVVGIAFISFFASVYMAASLLVFPPASDRISLCCSGLDHYPGRLVLSVLSAGC